MKTMTSKLLSGGQLIRGGMIFETSLPGHTIVHSWYIPSVTTYIVEL